MTDNAHEQEPQPAGTIVAQLSIYAAGRVTPGPGQTWDDVPESSRPDPTPVESNLEDR